jgi:hypothetical protein
MNYPDGQPAMIGDTVALQSDRYGVVVCSIDSDSFTPDFPRGEWNYLAKGIVIRTHDAALFHYTEPDEDLKLIGRG